MFNQLVPPRFLCDQVRDFLRTKAPDCLVDVLSVTNREIQRTFVHVLCLDRQLGQACQKERTELDKFRFVVSSDIKSGRVRRGVKRRQANGKDRKLSRGFSLKSAMASYCIAAHERRA
jgi:hypothetical protein